MGWQLESRNWWESSRLDLSSLPSKRISALEMRNVCHLESKETRAAQLTTYGYKGTARECKLRHFGKDLDCKCWPGRGQLICNPFRNVHVGIDSSSYFRRLSSCLDDDGNKSRFISNLLCEIWLVKRSVKLPPPQQGELAHTLSDGWTRRRLQLRPFTPCNNRQASNY